MDADALNTIAMLPVLVGGLVGTITSLTVPVFIALVVTKVNVKASLAASFMWIGFLGLSMFVAMGGDLYHTFNAALGYVMVSSFVAVPLLAFILSLIWPFRKPEEPENPANYIFGTPTSEDNERPA